jgi:TRAP-type C4-dicarboxylate transport system permease large subunit
VLADMTEEQTRRTARDRCRRGRADRHRRGRDLHPPGADPGHRARRVAHVEPDAADRGRWAWRWPSSSTSLFIDPLTGPGATFLILAIPTILAIYGVGRRWPAGANDLLRVVFPPLILIVAVLGSILGGITNPTPAAALGAAGAIMLAAYRKLKEENGKSKIVIWASFAIIIMILLGVNFDLRITREVVPFEDWVAYVLAQIAYHFAFFGLLFSCWVLFRSNILSPVVRETAKVTSMVFTILIGSQLLNLVLISFGGEHHIQQFLRSFDNEMVVFLVVMLILFILGFVLDFLEIIYIVIPIVGPVIYGGTLDPKWVTIMIAVNLQTSFLTPPFGFALFYLRGVAPPQVTTGHIYRGVLPFVGIQVLGLALLVAVPRDRDDPAGPARLTRGEIEMIEEGASAAPFSWNGSGSCIRSQRLPHGSRHCATRP